MQLSDLVKPIEEQTDEELRERLSQVRSRREQDRPARAKHKEKAVKKEVKKKVAPIEKLLMGLSEEDLQRLLQEHGK
jgi:hypothetical protein